MDIAAILAKLTGLALFSWTVRSIFLHVKEKKQAIREDKDKKDDQSVSEQVLNNVLLYLWLAFMVAFSTGMIINN